MKTEFTRESLTYLTKSTVECLEYLIDQLGRGDTLPVIRCNSDNDGDYDIYCVECHDYMTSCDLEHIPMGAGATCLDCCKTDEAKEAEKERKRAIQKEKDLATIEGLMLQYPEEFKTKENK